MKASHLLVEGVDLQGVTAVDCLNSHPWHLCLASVMDHSVKNEGDGSAEVEVVETPQRTDGSDASNTAEVATSATPKQREDPSGVTDEVSRLRELHADIRDQDDLERDISRQVLGKIFLI